jgi:hypothetical protein
LIAVVALVAFIVAASPAMSEDRIVAWCPHTEKVAPDEMFVVALGIGMPTPIIRRNIISRTRIGGNR